MLWKAPRFWYWIINFFQKNQEDNWCRQFPSRGIPNKIVNLQHSQYTKTRNHYWVLPTFRGKGCISIACRWHNLFLAWISSLCRDYDGEDAFGSAWVLVYFIYRFCWGLRWIWHYKFLHFGLLGDVYVVWFCDAFVLHLILAKQAIPLQILAVV